MIYHMTYPVKPKTSFCIWQRFEKIRLRLSGAVIYY
ncbi:hypothetical protein DET0798 [Dehalococcoides mccartyi 195]|uniref:Uncharacterized protein n=1 Tax=Dehalococcoides mccartyi (strain ATCC BAA-2266 / KCTC 15142 / 195) TaxID=243164 RepID=Q3Z8B9_DEHM1|nr:hypothetical protein DET0798 [Dehalococcoides mccartyi 195]